MTRWMIDTTVVRFREAEAAYLRAEGVEGRFRSIEAAGVPTRVFETGHGPPLVMLHGGGGLAVQWAPVMARLPGRRLLAPDRPGFGLSGRHRYEPATLRSFAVRWTTGVLDALGIARADIVANSMGGLWALWTALDQPLRVRSLQLVGTPALILDTSAPLPMRVMGAQPWLGRRMMAATRPGAEGVQALFRGLGHDPDRLDATLLELVALAETIPGYADAWLSLLRSVFSPLARVRAGLHVPEADLHHLVAPVTYVWGEADPFGSTKVAARAARATRGAPLHLIGEGHLPWLDDADGCARVVAGALDALDELSSTQTAEIAAS